MKTTTLLLTALLLGSASFAQINFIAHPIAENGLGYMEETFAADLDGDGDLDVLLAHEDNISWFKNLDGLGNFGSLQTITSSLNTTTSVYANDIDGDGYMDVLAASQYDNKIVWYANDGSGNFGAEQVISTNAAHARSVFAIDLDGDTDIDVLSASLNDDKIAWYQNDGSGNFGIQIIISNTADGAEDVHAADMDNDGDADVLSASFFDDKIAWNENDGNGIFYSESTVGNVDGAYAIFPADLDGDGDMDILTAAIDNATIDWYENIDGAGTFGPAQTIMNVIGGAFSVYASDLDGDADMDVVYGTDTRIAWHENLGQGNFGAQQVVYTSTFGVAKIVTGDINGDSRTDILGFYPGQLLWFENSDVVAVGEKPSPRFSIFPNPAQDVVTVVSDVQIAKIKLYDPLGRLVLSETNVQQIDLSALKSGMYQVKVENVQGQSAALKITKE